MCFDCSERCNGDRNLDSVGYHNCSNLNFTVDVWVINGTATTIPVNGNTRPTVAIGSNGNYTVNGSDTGIKAGTGATHINVKADVTANVTIGDNGNWFINGTDTGIKKVGDNAHLEVGPNGNFFLNGSDTGVKAVAK